MQELILPESEVVRCPLCGEFNAYCPEYVMINDCECTSKNRNNIYEINVINKRIT